MNMPQEKNLETFSYDPNVISNILLVGPVEDPFIKKLKLRGLQRGADHQQDPL